MCTFRLRRAPLVGILTALLATGVAAALVFHVVAKIPSPVRPGLSAREYAAFFGILVALTALAHLSGRAASRQGIRPPRLVAQLPSLIWGLAALIFLGTSGATLWRNAHAARLLDTEPLSTAVAIRLGLMFAVPMLFALFSGLTAGRPAHPGAGAGEGASRRPTATSEPSQGARP